LSITIRRCRPRDAASLTRIAHASKRHWGYPEAWIEAWRKELTLEPEFVEAHEVHLAEMAEENAGLYALVEKQGERIELEHFWVDPAHMGRGVGRALLQHAVATSHKFGATAIDILSDPNAEEFYLRFGARRVGEEAMPVLGEVRSLPRLVLEIAT